MFCDPEIQRKSKTSYKTKNGPGESPCLGSLFAANTSRSIAA